MTDEQYMDIAIEISKNAKYPYGAIVVKNNEIIGRSDDPTLMAKSMYSHAELMAIESACKDNKNLYGELKGSTMYVSCEPCMMCMGAILYEQIDRLVYASTIEDSDKYVCKEVICNSEELANLANSKMEILSEFNREKATHVLKEYEYESYSLWKHENIKHYSYKDVLVGDLVFFKNKRGRVNHVGIYVGDSQFIHAANPKRGVVIDYLDSRNSYYNERYVTARRV